MKRTNIQLFDKEDIGFKLDIVIPIKTELISFAIELTIPSVLKNLKYHKIFILTKRQNFEVLVQHFSNELILIDEDHVCDGLTIKVVKNYLSYRIGTTWRAGWYFQQFIKLAMAWRNDVSNDYLVWDADSIALKPINFFTKTGRIFVTKSKEYHVPYFICNEKLTGIQKLVPYSFISEHMVFTKKHVISLLNEIMKISDDIWWKIILDQVDSKDLVGSGFSEYELYGNYIMNRDPNHFHARKLVNFRSGTMIFGLQPDNRWLNLFSLFYDYISFESSQVKIKSVIVRYTYIFLLLILAPIKKLKQFIKPTNHKTK